MDERELKPANENPWYVLMTLHGEQDGDEIDEELHEKNRRAWNAWAGQALSEDGQAKAAHSSRVDLSELQSWRKMQVEINQRYSQEMRRRNDDHFSVPELPSPTEIISFMGIHTLNSIVFTGCVFPSFAYFRKATFNADVDFNNATFNSDAYFRNAIFSEDASFHNATFSADADFSDAIFNADVNVSNATFNAVAFFHNVTFSADAYFQNTTYNSVAFFHNATFSEDAVFRNANFSVDAYFSNSNFNTVAVFSLATFNGFAKFVKTQFGRQDSETIFKVDFADSQFEKPTSFRDAVFLHTYPDLTGTLFHDKTSFTPGVDFWPKETSQSAKEAREACGIIRHLLGKQGLPEDEHFFFRREMEFAGKTGSVLQNLPYKFFWLVSDYGHSIARPLCCLLGVGLVTAMMLLAGFATQDISLDNDWRFVEPFSLTFANMFKIFGFQRSVFGFEYLQGLPMWMQFIAGVQTIAGFVFLFFLGLGLRQRFRLR